MKRRKKTSMQEAFELTGKALEKAGTPDDKTLQWCITMTLMRLEQFPEEDIKAALVGGFSSRGVNLRNVDFFQ